MNNYVLVSGDFTTWGGMDRANYELAWHLAEQDGASVHLVSHFVAAPLVDHPNITWHRVPKPLNSDVLAEPRLNRYGQRVAESLRGVVPRVIVNGGNCSWNDVNWVHYVHSAYQPEVGSSALRQWKSSWSHNRFRAAEKRAFRAARVIVANSERTQNDLIEHFGISAELIHPVYYGIDPVQFCPRSDAEIKQQRTALGWDPARLTAVFVGALSDRRKGFDLAYAAWSLLIRESDWDVNLVAIGAGAEVDYWRRRAAGDRLEHRVQLMGFTRDIAPAITSADLLVSPTRYEAYGLGVHEAICCGIPAFVTCGAGVAEKYPIELSDRLLTDPPNAADLAVRLRNWRENVLHNRSRSEEFGARLRERSWADMAREVIAVMEANRLT
jgi:glycosyltransferase involved in cell wall biosynthesis